MVSVDLGPALERLGGRRLLAAEWPVIDGAGLHRVARRLRGTLTHAIHQVAATDLGTPLPLTAGLDDPAPLFGPRWPGHPFGHEPTDLGVDLHEAQYLRMLAWLLSPERQGEIAVGRTRSFLTALFQAAGREPPAKLASLDARVAVQAEHRIGPTSAGGRIDLLVSWPRPSGAGQCLVAVEAKFDHIPTYGQLGAYADYLRKRTRAGDVTSLFLVELTPRPRGRPAERWTGVTWLAVLRRWEALLAAAGDADLAFARFRAALWRKLTL